MTRLAVVDHGAGNLVSIAQGLRRTGSDVSVVTSPEGLNGADGVVLPGVGSTAAVMEGIRAAGFEEALCNLDVPLLGICVGMQVLFDRSEEDDTDCLGLLAGDVMRLRHAPRLPHIGWNNLALTAADPLLMGLPADPTVYFVHSFAPVPSDEDAAIATTEYGTEIVAAVRKGLVAGVQFHPERSGSNGLKILANFVGACREASRAA